jgi:hypothetical protein
MTKRINPTIYRIGTKNDWRHKYIEKKETEQKHFSFNVLEINEYIQIYFNYHGLNPLTSKLFLNKNTLHIFIIYSCVNVYNSNRLNFVNFKFTNKKSNLFLLKLKKIQDIKLKTLLKKRNNFAILKNIQISTHTISNLKTNLSLNSSRNKIFTYLNFLKVKQSQTLHTLFLNKFLHKFIVSIQLYFKNKISVLLTLKQLIRNNFPSVLSKNQKKNLALDIIKTRRFEQNEFYKEVINVIYQTHFVNNKAALIANLLKVKLSNIKKLKSTNYFIYFIRSTIKYFLYKYKLIDGIKIKISGNLSKRRRAITKIIKIGKNINVLRLNSKLSYEESTCYTKKGSFGIKVYIE